MITRRLTQGYNGGKEFTITELRMNNGKLEASGTVDAIMERSVVIGDLPTDDLLEIIDELTKIKNLHYLKV